jgi:integrase
MRAKISNSTVSRLKPDPKPYEVNDTELRGFLLRVQPSGTMTYYCAYRLPTGQRSRMKIGSSGIYTPAQARDQAKLILAEVAQGNDPRAAKRAAKVNDLRGFIEDRYRSWAATHLRQGERNVQRIISRFPGLLSKQLSDVNPWVIEKWRSERLKGKISRVTVNNDVSALRSALSKAVEWQIIPAHPLAGLKPLKVDASGNVRFLTDDEEGCIRDALDEREDNFRKERDSANAWRRERDYPELPDLRSLTFVDHLKPMVLLSINTGLRRGEVFHLQWSGVDLDRATVTVVGLRAKSRQTRHVPLNAEALSVLKGWKGPQANRDGLVFPGKEGRPFDNVNTAWRGLLKLAGIADFRWHDMRHHFASRLVMAGVDLNTVRELLGHSDIKMTLRYAHLASEHKAAAVERLVNHG